MGSTMLPSNDTTWMSLLRFADGSATSSATFSCNSAVRVGCPCDSLRAARTTSSSYYSDAGTQAGRGADAHAAINGSMGSSTSSAKDARLNVFLRSIKGSATPSAVVKCFVVRRDARCSEAYSAPFLPVSWCSTVNAAMPVLIDPSSCTSGCVHFPCSSSQSSAPMSDRSPSASQPHKKFAGQMCSKGLRTRPNWPAYHDTIAIGCPGLFNTWLSTSKPCPSLSTATRLARAHSANHNSSSQQNQYRSCCTTRMKTGQDASSNP